MLAFFCLVFAVEVSLAPRSNTTSQVKAVAHYVAAGGAAAACLTILVMPFRPPSLPIFDISTVGQVPSNDFRSPEDNLRLWQFLTVSWMAPLISLGRVRQLHEQDVWLLGFEFQHRRLHEKFRRIRGSVLGRLLKANGIDVSIISLISLVQMFCGSRILWSCSPAVLANVFGRLLYSCAAAATLADHDRSDHTETRPVDLRFAVLGASSSCCSSTGPQSVVRSSVLRTVSGRNGHDGL